MKVTYPIIISPVTVTDTDAIYFNNNHQAPGVTPDLTKATPQMIATAPLNSLYYAFDYDGFGGCVMAVNCTLAIPNHTQIFDIVSNRIGEKLIDALRAAK